MKATIEHYRAENPEGTVLIDGGDLFQGTMISNLQYGRPVVEQMNDLAYAAAAIGNHEFDWTADTLKNRVLNMRFAALGANMLERKSGKRPWWVRSDTTVARRGVKVGIFGLAYPGTPRVTMPAHVAHLRFADDSVTSAPLPGKLRKGGASLVVGVGHIPAETDSTRRAKGDIARLAHGIRGVDGWFGGHSHNVVDDVIENAPVMVAGANGQWLAIADYTVDPVARTVVAGETSHRMLQVFADEFPIDTAWTARVERWNAEVGPVAATVLGKSSYPLDRNRPEATIGNFICDAMRFSSGADIALQNPGGMRANMAAGTVTRAMVYDVMPFDNTIVTMELTGAEVRRALRAGAARRAHHAGERDPLRGGHERSGHVARGEHHERRRHAVRRGEDVQGRGEQLHGLGRRQLRRTGRRPQQVGQRVRDPRRHGGVRHRPLQGRRGARDQGRRTHPERESLTRRFERTPNRRPRTGPPVRLSGSGRATTSRPCPRSRRTARSARAAPRA
ncbi:MAG: 5'-nucleotidase C-terminal domain-containing protein [Candidatus Eisenbacteria bacterium]